MKDKIEEQIKALDILEDFKDKMADLIFAELYNLSRMYPLEVKVAKFMNEGGDPRVWLEVTVSVTCTKLNLTQSRPFTDRGADVTPGTGLCYLHKNYYLYGAK